MHLAVSWDLLLSKFETVGLFRYCPKYTVREQAELNVVVLTSAWTHLNSRYAGSSWVRLLYHTAYLK